MAEIKIFAEASGNYAPDCIKIILTHAINQDNYNRLIDQKESEKYAILAAINHVTEENPVILRDVIRPLYKYENNEQIDSGYEYSGEYSVTAPFNAEILRGVTAMVAGLNLRVGISYRNMLKNSEEKSRELIKSAINKARAKAEIIASEIGETIDRVSEIEYHTTHSPMLMKAQMNSSYEQPDITLTESVTAIFKTKKD